MEKTKKKTIEQSGACKGGGVYGGKDLRKRYLLYNQQAQWHTQRKK